MTQPKHGIACAAAFALTLGSGVALAQSHPDAPEAHRGERSAQHQPEHAERGVDTQARQDRRAQEPAPEDGRRAEATERSRRGDRRFASLDRAQRRQVQERLQQEGYYEGEIDGIYGPMTREALRRYQQSQDLQATGTLDRETSRAMGIDASGEVQRVRGVTGEDASSRSQRADASIRLAQQALSQAGYETGPADGVMGPNTERAIRDYQRANDLRVTGDLDAQTRRSLGVAQDDGQAAPEQSATEQGASEDRTRGTRSDRRTFDDAAPAPSDRREQRTPSRSDQPNPR